MLKYIGGQDEDDKQEATPPSIHTIGLLPFLRYVAIGLLMQNVLFYMLVTFNFASFTDTLINIVGSTVLSFLIVWFIESIRSKT